MSAEIIDFGSSRTRRLLHQHTAPARSGGPQSPLGRTTGTPAEKLQRLTLEYPMEAEEVEKLLDRLLAKHPTSGPA